MFPSFRDRLFKFVAESDASTDEKLDALRNAIQNIETSAEDVRSIEVNPKDPYTFEIDDAKRRANIAGDIDFSIIRDDIFEDVHGNVHATFKLLSDDRLLYAVTLHGFHEEPTIYIEADWNRLIELSRQMPMYEFVNCLFCDPWSHPIVIPCSHDLHTDDDCDMDREIEFSKNWSYVLFLSIIIQGKTIVSKSIYSNMELRNFANSVNVRSIITSLENHGFKTPKFVYFEKTY